MLRIQYNSRRRIAVTDLISRPTPRLLSFVLCLEWINGTYNTIHYRPHGWVGTTTPKIDRKHMNWRNMPENLNTIYTVKIVNKRPRNLLNEIRNVFINGKQVKTAKITQIIPQIIAKYQIIRCFGVKLLKSRNYLRYFGSFNLFAVNRHFVFRWVNCVVVYLLFSRHISCAYFWHASIAIDFGVVVSSQPCGL